MPTNQTEHSDCAVPGTDQIQVWERAEAIVRQMCDLAEQNNAEGAQWSGSSKQFARLFNELTGLLDRLEIAGGARRMDVDQGADERERPCVYVPSIGGVIGDVHPKP